MPWKAARLLVLIAGCLLCDAAHAQAPQMLSLSDIDGLRNRIQQCFAIPPEAKGLNLHIGIKFKLKPDGTLDGAPKIVEQPKGKIGKAATAMAVRAIVKCQPYDLPVGKYDLWKELEMSFNADYFARPEKKSP